MSVSFGRVGGRGMNERSRGRWRKGRCGWLGQSCRGRGIRVCGRIGGILYVGTTNEAVVSGTLVPALDVGTHRQPSCTPNSPEI